MSWPDKVSGVSSSIKLLLLSCKGFHSLELIFTFLVDDPELTSSSELSESDGGLTRLGELANLALREGPPSSASALDETLLVRCRVNVVQLHVNADSADSDCTRIAKD